MRLIPVFLAMTIIAAGCSGSRSTEAPQRIPWPTADAPDSLLSLAGDLGAFQGATGRLPESLALLDRSGLAATGPYATHGYAFHPDGLGLLTDNWRVIAVDDRIRVPGKAWSLLRPPVRRTDAPPLVVALVPLAELRAAAEAPATLGSTP